LPASQFFDLRAGLTHGRLDFALQVINVFNEHVLATASLFGDAVATSPALIAYTPARTVSMSVQAQF
jgi:outer membrane receptor protein involved in Fe transport